MHGQNTAGTALLTMLVTPWWAEWSTSRAFLVNQTKPGSNSCNVSWLGKVLYGLKEGGRWADRVRCDLKPDELDFFLSKYELFLVEDDPM